MLKIRYNKLMPRPKQNGLIFLQTSKYLASSASEKNIPGHNCANYYLRYRNYCYTGLVAK
jgi:hypothetical protein